MVNTMMDVLKNNFIVIFSISVVGVITFIVFKGTILGVSSTRTAEQLELVKRFVELCDAFEMPNDKPFEYLPSQEQSAIIDELISIAEKLGINNVDRLNLLNEKKEALAEAMESLKNLRDELAIIDGTKDHCLAMLQNLTGMSLQEVKNIGLPSRPPVTMLENQIWALCEHYQNNLAMGRYKDNLWENLEELKDNLNIDISNMVLDILKELV